MKCLFCENEFIARRKCLENIQKFCSSKCYWNFLKTIPSAVKGKHWKVKDTSNIGMQKEKHWNWKGGKSFEQYGLEFNEDLKEVIRNRDRQKCYICKKTELENKEKLSIHHIDYNKQNNNPNNLISLCRKCHVKTNFNRNYWKYYFLKHLK